MPASKNSRPSRTSKPGRTAKLPVYSRLSFAVAVAVAALSGELAAWWVYGNGFVLYFGDAEAHLNIARRVVDSRTPGFEQLGTVWLPLPHLLMLAFVGDDGLWRNGLAGTIPGVACFTVACGFLFAGVRRALSSTAAGFVAMLAFAWNPNLLYLQATPMTEPVFFAALAGIFYFTVLFRDTQSTAAVTGAGLFSLMASLTRYDGWFVLPFVAVYIAFAAREHRWRMAAIYCALAALGPACWLAHNAWYYANPLEFYNGPYSAKGIYERALRSGMARYAGDRDWGKAWLYFGSASQLCAGLALTALGVAGLVAAVIKRAVWALVFLALGPVFYVLSMYSSGTPIFVPHLWPQSYYNTRYGLAALPLLAFGAAAIVAIVPERFRVWAGVAIVGVCLAPWLAYPRPDAWICWKESQVNSEARRTWTREAAAFLKANYRPGDGLMASFGDVTGVLREAGIPLRESLHEGNGLAMDAARLRPELFLHEKWGVAIAGDSTAEAMQRAQKHGLAYRCVKIVAAKGAPVIEIYRRERSIPAR